MINDTQATSREVLEDLQKTTTTTTTLLEAAPSLDSEVVDLAQSLVPAREEGIEEILQREYQVSDIAWSYTNVGNANIAILQFPKLLTDLTPVWDRLKRFVYFRADLHLRFRVNTTPYHYGAVLVSTQGNSPVSTDWAEHVVQMSGSQSVVLSANSQTPVDMEIPYLLPVEYLRNKTTFTNELAEVQIRVISPLKISGSGTNPAISISVFAAFKNIKLLGASTIVATSDLKVSKKTSPKEETQKKQGFIGKSAKVVGDIAGSLSKLPVIGGIASAVSPIADAVGFVADIFGWDKPPVLKPARPVSILPAHDWQTNRTAIDSVVFGPDQDYRVSTEDSVFGVSTPEARSLKALIMRPMYSHTASITSAQAASTVFHTINVKPYKPVTDAVSKTWPDFLSHLCKFHDSWRGGIKYLVYVSTSSYTSARVRVTYQPNGGAVASVPNGGEANSRVVEIQGDTIFTFTVPYTSDSAYEKVYRDIADTNTGIGRLHFSLVSTVQTSGSTDTIYFNVFRAGAEDFEFNNPCNVVQPNCDFQKEFKKTFDSIIPGATTVVQENLVRPPPFAHTLDYVKIYGNDEYTLNTATGATVNNLKTKYLDYLSPFRYWRGALHVATAPYDGTLSFSRKTQSPAYRTLHTAPNANFTAVTMPFDCDWRFRSFASPDSPTVNALDVWNASGAQIVYSVFAGDDFQVAGIKGPAKTTY